MYYKNAIYLFNDFSSLFLGKKSAGNHSSALLIFAFAAAGLLSGARE
jgi:hypothetical protein